MEKIKCFTEASIAALGCFLKAMPAEDQVRIDALLGAGNSLAMTHVIHSDGSSCVMFECLLADGTRRVLAHVNGKNPTVQ